MIQKNACIQVIGEVDQEIQAAFPNDQFVPFFRKLIILAGPPFFLPGFKKISLRGSPRTTGRASIISFLRFLP